MMCPEPSIQFHTPLLLSQLKAVGIFKSMRTHTGADVLGFGKVGERWQLYRQQGILRFTAMGARFRHHMLSCCRMVG